MKRLLLILVAAIVACLGFPAPSASAGEVPITTVHTYGYDGHAQPATSTLTTTERGPPASDRPATTDNAVDLWSDGALACPSGAAPRAIYAYEAPLIHAQVGSAAGTTNGPARPNSSDLSLLEPRHVAAKSVDELAEIGFRSDTSHIFRNAAGHLADDTAENRALIKSAVDPANLRDTITLKDGATLQKYFRDLPDGTQAWAEVRNGEITNGGLNVIPR